jgi:hypothetical protein
VRTFIVDDKIRTQDWPDVLLKGWSDETRRSPDWAQKPLVCDFIAYAYVPAATCVLLPVPGLQRVWRQQDGVRRSIATAQRAWPALYCK